MRSQTGDMALHYAAMSGDLLTLKIQQAGKLLVQTHQQLSDGRVQEMWQLLGCKLPPNELEGARRFVESAFLPFLIGE